MGLGYAISQREGEAEGLQSSSITVQREMENATGKSPPLLCPYFCLSSQQLPVSWRPAGFLWDSGQLGGDVPASFLISLCWPFACVAETFHPDLAFNCRLSFRVSCSFICLFCLRVFFWGGVQWESLKQNLNRNLYRKMKAPPKKKERKKRK